MYTIEEMKDEVFRLENQTALVWSRLANGDHDNLSEEDRRFIAYRLARAFDNLKAMGKEWPLETAAYLDGVRIA